jgi:hypothetical protein
MSESSPWDDIAVPGADFNVRQVPGETAVPCFWGRDTTGACLFIVELGATTPIRSGRMWSRCMGSTSIFAGASRGGNALS